MIRTFIRGTFSRAWNLLHAFASSSYCSLVPRGRIPFGQHFDTADLKRSQVLGTRLVLTGAMRHPRFLGPEMSQTPNGASWVTTAPYDQDHPMTA